MVFAIAALMLQFGSVPAVPAAAASSAAAAKSAAVAPKPAAAPSIPAIATLPDAPLPSNAAPSALPSANSSSASSSQEGQRQPAVLRVAALDAARNDNQTLSTIRIPEANRPFRPVSVESVPSPKRWLALSIAQSSAATFDAYSTRRALEGGAHEADPMMRPFAGSSGIYAAIQVCPVVLDYTAKHMQRSEIPFVRHTWWLPQTLGTGLYLFSGVHNMQIAAH